MQTLRRAVVAAHYPVYQTLLAVLGTVFSIHFLFDYSLTKSLGYGVVTVLAYWIGQGIVAMLQRPMGGGPRSKRTHDESMFR